MSVPNIATPASYVKTPGSTLRQALAGWYSAKANAATTPAVIAIFGDSIAGGYNLTDGILNGYPNRLMGLLTAAGYTNYGQAYTATPYMVNPQQIATAQWFHAWHNTSMTPTEGGLGRAVYENSTTGAQLTSLTIPAGAIGCDIITCDLVSGTWGYKIDGGSTITVNSTPTTGGTAQQNAVFRRTSIALSSNTTLSLGYQSAGDVFMPTMVAFRFATTGIGIVVQTTPGGCASDLTTAAGTATSAIVSGVSTVPGASFPDDKMLPWAGATTVHNAISYGWPVNPNLAVIAYYANTLGAARNFEQERRGLNRLCAALRAGNSNVSILFLVNNVPDEVYAASTYYTQQLVAERAAHLKGVIHSVAHAVGAAVLDIDQKWGSTAVSQGFLPSNNVHPTGTGATSSDGHYDIAQALVSVI